MIDAIFENLREYWQLHSLLALYTVMLAWHAWKGNKDTKGLADYYVGGRSMGGVVIGLSFFATYGSTNSFVGFAGQSYAWGLPWFLLVPFLVGFALLAWIAIAPRLRRFTEALDSLTIADFVGLRFSSTPARVFAANIILFASFFYLSAVFQGIGHLLEYYMEMPYVWAIGVVFLVTMLYTAVGGFISVVRTDAIQGVVLAIAGIVLIWGTASAAGGLGAMESLRATPEGAQLLSFRGGIALPLLLGTLFSATVKMAVEPRQLSRFYALADARALRTGMWVSVGLFAVVYACLVPLGLFAHGILGSGITDTDLVVPQLLISREVFSSGTAAFLMVAMVAAAMSSVDSVLLVMASTCERDIVGIFRPGQTDAGALRQTRWYVALFASITAVISLNPASGIVTLTAFSGALYAACFFPAVLLGLFWRRGNGPVVMSSFVAGLVVLLVWEYVPGSAVIHEVFPAVLLSFGAYVGVAVLTPPARVETVDRLFGELETEALAAASAVRG